MVLFLKLDGDELLERSSRRTVVRLEIAAGSYSER